MTRPPKPPIVHRLEQRRRHQPPGDDVGAMFWAAVLAMVVLAGAILVVGVR